MAYNSFCQPQFDAAADAVALKSNGLMVSGSDAGRSI